MKRKVITILSIIGIIALCVFAGINIYQSHRVTANPSGTLGNTAGNLYNGGLFCEDEDYVYFANPYDGNSLYRMTPDETGIKKIAGTPVQSINAAGSYIYYYQSGTGSGEGLGYMFNLTGVYQMSKKTSSKVTCIDKISGSNILLADNALYYNASEDDGWYLRCADLIEDTKENVVNCNIAIACADNGTLYFQNNDGNMHLMGMSLSSSTPYEVLAEDVYMPIVRGTTAYYIDIHNNYALVRYDLTNGTKTVLDATRTDMFNMSDNYIYYQTSGDNPQFKRVTLDGSTTEVILDGAYNSISITSRYVYFLKFGSDIPMYKIPLDGALQVTEFTAALQAAISASD